MAEAEMKHKEKAKKRKGSAKKKFFEAKIPLTATKVHLYGYDAEDFNGAVVKIDLSKNLRGKNLELKSKIKFVDGVLVGELLSLSLAQAYMKKVMRRGTDYIEDSFETESKDSVLRIKPFMITRNRVSRAVRNNIREIAKKHLQSKIKINKTEDLFSEVMTNKMQKELSLKVKKVYPLAMCEIRVLEVVSAKQ
jgi:ribosomal protein S3AE